MATGRSRGPASRPPRRPAGARPRTATRGAATASAPVAARLGWRGRLTTAAKDRRTRRGAVLLSIVAFLLVLLGSTVAAYVGQQGDIAALQDKVAGQQQDVAALKAEQERWRDPAYVEQQARQRLKFVKPGERSFTVLDADPATGATDPVAGVGGSHVPLAWYQTVWESTRAADVPGARR
jgi:cell division protein FtsB